MPAIRTILLSAAGTAVLASAAPDAVAGTPVIITYVPNSLAEFERRGRALDPPSDGARQSA